MSAHHRQTMAVKVETDLLALGGRMPQKKQAPRRKSWMIFENDVKTFTASDVDGYA